MFTIEFIDVGLFKQSFELKEQCLLVFYRRHDGTEHIAPLCGKCIGQKLVSEKQRMLRFYADGGTGFEDILNRRFPDVGECGTAYFLVELFDPLYFVI